MLTDRGRWTLALGGATYLAAWAFGSDPLYPVALGLVLAVGSAALWVRLCGRPARLLRTLAGGEHVAGDDLQVTLEAEVEGRIPPGSLLVTERIGRLGAREILLTRSHGRLRGGYVLRAVPRGRYPIGRAEAVLEDPFGFGRAEVALGAPDAFLVYPRLVELDALFTESGRRLSDGRRLLLRRPSGFELHSVREYEDGESLRRVHWPSTAKRGRLMVKELEDAPRDEVLVVLDCDARGQAGSHPDTSFELALSAAGSILKAHAARGRRAGLLVAAAPPRYQTVRSLEGDWKLALELLAAAEPDAVNPVTTLLTEGVGIAARALELAIVTSTLSPRLVDRLVQRAFGHHGSALVYVDPTSFAGRPDAGAPLPADARAQLARLGHVGVPVAVLRRGDALAEKLGAPSFARSRGRAGEARA